MLVQQEISRELNEKKIGNIYEVLVEEKIDEDTYLGRTMEDAQEIDNIVYIKSEKEILIGSFVDVKIYDALEYDLMGEII